MTSDVFADDLNKKKKTSIKINQIRQMKTLTEPNPFFSHRRGLMIA